jgi:uncharacterized protein
MTPVSGSGGEGQAPLRDLEPGACMRLVGQRGVGRYVFRSERGPVALPVNYAVVDGDFLFRTSPESGFVAGVPDAPVSFEVDRWDEGTRSGWSVLVTGRIQQVPEGCDFDRSSEGPTPWPAGDHSVLLRLIPRQITGRFLAV